MSKNYRSELVGAFGYPIDKNPTCVMEEAAFAAAGPDYRYLTIKAAKEAGLKTIPSIIHKDMCYEDAEYLLWIQISINGLVKI